MIAGIDEVGMGCLAGPVIAAAVILNPEGIPKGIDDSKRLSEKIRIELNEKIRLTARAVAVGMASVEEIDTINIYHAAKLAMVRAIEGLSLSPDFVLMDGRGSLALPVQQLAVVEGDQKSVSIAAASIVAKVYRDDLMRAMDLKFPGYEFAKHKGYGSLSHRTFLQAKGRSPIHRKSFSWTIPSSAHPTT
mgnify:CR=1 FL=1